MELSKSRWKVKKITMIKKLKISIPEVSKFKDFRALEGKSKKYKKGLYIPYYLIN